MVKRRSVVLGLTGLGALVGLAATRVLRGADAEAIAAIVFKRLDYLRLDPAGVRRFASDYAAQHLISHTKLSIVNAAGPLYTWLPLARGGFPGRDIRHGEDRIVTQYLLSSDFFISGSDAGRTVRYLGFYDALRGCGNPWARPVTQPA